MTRNGALGASMLRHSLVLSLLPLGVVGAVAYFVASSSLAARISEYLEEQAFQLSRTIQQNLDDAAVDASTWARLSVIKGGLIFSSYEKSSQYLEDFARAYPHYRAVHLYDGGGELVASSSAPKGVRPEDVEAALGGRNAATGVRRDDEGASVVFGAPVTDGRDENVTGALVIELDWNSVLDVIDRAESHARRRGHGSYRILLVNARGRLIGSRDRDSFESTVPTEGAVDSALAGETGTTRQRLLSEEGDVFVGFASFGGLGDAGFPGAVVVTESVREAFSPVSRLGWLILFVAALASAAAFGLSQMLTRTVVRPVAAAAASARAIANGELPDDIDVEARHELLELRNSLNQMTAELRRVAALADEIARGRLPSALAPRSEHDHLRHSLDGMTKYLARMARRAERIAEGDLRETVETASRDDVLGAAFQKMAGNLETLLSQVQQLADQSASAAAEIAASAEQSARNGDEATRSAARLIDTVRDMSAAIETIAGGDRRRSDDVVDEGSSLGRMTESIRSNAESVDRLVAAARDATGATGRGQHAMVKASQGMEGIRSAIDGAMEAVTTLGGRAENIGEIVLVIEEIAEQTNLLALNAAIEAARAGEHGSGFAVVADEVRKLAERSARSASEIASLIRDIDLGVRSAVDVMSQSHDTVEEGIARTGEVATNWDTINDVVRSLNEQIHQIESATTLQMTGAERIAESSKELRGGSAALLDTTRAMRDAVSENAAGSSQLATSAQSLSDQVEKLNQLLSRFALAGGTNGKPGAHVSPPAGERRGPNGGATRLSPSPGNGSDAGDGSRVA